jgi:hypothetical protein
MKQQIFSNWNFMRVIRLGLGLAIFVQAILSRDMMFGLVGLLISGMAVFNIGCCGIGGCYTQPKKNLTSQTNKEIIYEEVG